MNIQARMAEKVKIVKVGATPPPPPSAGRKKTATTTRKKSMRTFPRGILKGTRSRVKPVQDPAKPPPLKRGRTLRILTEKGVEKRRERIRKTIRAIPDKVLREKLRKSGLPVSGGAPPELVQAIAVGGMESGLLSPK